MIRSLALIFAAVTLRIEFPILIAVHLGAFTPAYQIVSWLCWVPNLIWAEWYVRRTRGGARASELPRHSRGAARRRLVGTIDATFAGVAGGRAIAR